MSLKLSGRRRAVGSRTLDSNHNKSNVHKMGEGLQSGNKSCSHGCDCSAPSNSKYRTKGWTVSAVFAKILPLAIFVYGVMILGSGSKPLWKVLLSRSSSSSSKAVKKDAVVGNCELRKYPKRRYYGLQNRPLPNFLDTEYIYGELPLLINPKQQSPNQSQTKLCVDQSEWFHPQKETTTAASAAAGGDKDSATTTSVASLPFADGTNPSILKLVDNPRIDPSIRELLKTSVAGDPFYLATICMTNSQCSWMDSPQEIAEFKLSKDSKPATERTVFLVLNQQFETLVEATIYTKIDAKFGRVKPKNNQMRTFKLDDARLFTHKGQIWVSYREGKQFGYDKQVLNKVHFDFVDASDQSQAETKGLKGSTNNNKKKEFTVTLLASDTETLCCGRNMALIDNVHTDQLQALTWVDPVTVVDVDVSKTDGIAETQRRRLAENKKKKSHFHGTNGFMVHLPKTGEYLGIGHFHRPHDREKNDYARFGHHYTHAFFTITDQPPIRLKRLSAELVLASDLYPNDAEIIQFWSGLELSTDQHTGKESLALAYGINDCEGAALHLDLAFVEGFLRDVPEGKEVVDLMMPLKEKA